VKVLRLTEADDVGIALTALAAGDALGIGDIRALEPIAAGHKVALRRIEAGAAVVKYGAIIGQASQAIAAGAHVHSHNLGFVASSQEAAIGSDLRPVPTVLPPRTFEGYHRADGQIGTRNYIGILTSVNCSATVAKRIAAHFHEDRVAEFDHVDGVAAFTHTTGCGTASTGEGVNNLRRTLAG